MLHRTNVTTHNETKPVWQVLRTVNHWNGHDTTAMAGRVRHQGTIHTKRLQCPLLCLVRWRNLVRWVLNECTSRGRHVVGMQVLCTHSDTAPGDTDKYMAPPIDQQRTYKPVNHSPLTHAEATAKPQSSLSLLLQGQAHLGPLAGTYVCASYADTVLVQRLQPTNLRCGMESSVFKNMSVHGTVAIVSAMARCTTCQQPNYEPHHSHNRYGP